MITYPLNVMLAIGIGFALANDEEEHAALTAAGYVPALVASTTASTGSTGGTGGTTSVGDGSGHTLETVRATLDAAGIEYDNRLGLAKLVALLPA